MPAANSGVLVRQASERSKEAAFYGIDSEDFTDRVTQTMIDFMDGAMEDVKKDFVKTLQQQEKKKKGTMDVLAFYEEKVAPCVANLQMKMQKKIDKGADKFELYLARNCFKVPDKPVMPDAMDVASPSTQSTEEEEEEEEEEVVIPPANELPTPQAEEDMDEALTEMRVKIRTLRRQRKAVESLLTKATADLELTHKEARALRLHFFQALNIHPKMGNMADALECVSGQEQEVTQLMLEADGLIPRLDRRRRQEEAGEEVTIDDETHTHTHTHMAVEEEGGGGGRKKGGGGGGGVPLATDMSDIRTNTKEDLKALMSVLAPGGRPV